MTKIIVNNTYCQIRDLEDSYIITKLDDVLSYDVQNAIFTKAYKTGWWDSKQKKWCKWDGKNHLLSKNLSFRTGLLKKVEIILKNSNQNYIIKDNRKKIKFGRKIKGEITTEDTSYIYKGNFKNLIITAEYWNQDKTKLERGTFTLMVTGKGHQLKGMYSWYSGKRKKPGAPIQGGDYIWRKKRSA